MNELRRILSDRKRLLILLVLPLVCVAMFLLTKVRGDIRNGWKSLLYYRDLYVVGVEKYRGMDPAEIADQAQNEFRYLAAPSPYTQAVHVRDYQAYLDAVQKNAAKLSRSSVFGKDRNSFSYRNIQKTAADFETLRGIETEFGSDKAVTDWVGFRGGDVLFCLAMILVVLGFFEDRRRGVDALIRACPNGRLRLAVSRLGVLLFFSALYTLLLYAVTLWAAFALYGGVEDLGRSVQSIETFKTCTLHVSVAGWIALYMGVKVVCGFFIGLFFWLILSFLSHMQLAWLVIIGVLGLEYAAYFFITPQMAVSLLHFINIFSYIFPADLLREYGNMNFFGWPVGALVLLAVLLAVLVAILTPVVLTLQVRRYPYGNRDLLGRVIRVWNRFWDRLRTRFPIGVMEGYKLLILGGTLLFLAVGIYATRDLDFQNTSAYIQEMDNVYQQYIGEVKGPITQDTWDYLTKAREQLNSRSYVDGRFNAALTKLENEIPAIVERAGDAYEPWVTDQYTIKTVLGEKVFSLHRWNGLVALLFLILCTAPVFAFEKQTGAEQMLRSTSGGRGAVFRRKYLILFLETLLVWAAVYGREWLRVVELLGKDCLGAPIENVSVLQGFPVKLTLGGFLTLLYAVRFGGLLTAGHIMAWLSMRANAWEKAAALGVGVLLLPGALCYFDQTWAGYVSVLPFVDGTELLVGFTGDRLLTWLAPGWIALAIGMTVHNHKVWCAKR